MIVDSGLLFWATLYRHAQDFIMEGVGTDGSRTFFQKEAEPGGLGGSPSSGDQKLKQNGK